MLFPSCLHGSLAHLSFPLKCHLGSLPWPHFLFHILYFSNRVYQHQTCSIFLFCNIDCLLSIFHKVKFISYCVKIKHEGQVFDTAVKTPSRICTPHFRVPGFEFGFCSGFRIPDSSFLLRCSGKALDDGSSGCEMGRRYRGSGKKLKTRPPTSSCNAHPNPITFHAD